MRLHTTDPGRSWVFFETFHAHIYDYISCIRVFLCSALGVKKQDSFEEKQFRFSARLYLRVDFNHTIMANNCDSTNF